MAMVSLISKFKKLKVTDTEPAGLKPQSPWRTCERIIQGKFPKYKKGTDVAVPLSNPETLEPILARADRKEIPGILCKVIDDIHSDRMKGKRLVKEAIQNAKNPALLEQLTKVAHPVSVTKTSTPNRSWVGQETVETRDLNRQEITQARADFSQGGRSDAEYMFHLYFNGGRHLHLTNQEMQAVALTLENPALHEALTVVLESVVGTYSVWSWVAMAWRYAFPFLDYSQFEGGTTWRNPEEGIKILKKLGVLQCIYDEHTDHPLKTPLTNSVRRLILKGARAHYNLYSRPLCQATRLYLTFINTLKIAETCTPNLNCLFQFSLDQDPCGPLTAEARDTSLGTLLIFNVPGITNVPGMIKDAFHPEKDFNSEILLL